MIDLDKSLINVLYNKIIRIANLLPTKFNVKLNTDIYNVSFILFITFIHLCL